MQTLQRWKIVIKHPDTDNKDITIFIYDNHASGMLRKLTEIGFDFEVLGYQIYKI